MNLFELFVKIGVDDQASDKISSLSSKLGGGLATAAKVGAAAVSAAGTAIVAIGKQAIEQYAEYEQLVGGAKLMFGDAYDFVAEKAKNAYSTVQMSQNDYLQQVNGFATGLKTALGGNEQAAAELADKIINAEADVVAATGNSQEAVQNAFNGIMKSNYTMLDNLQIGITPTKEGFQEVIDKVNEWNAANGEATNYVIDNLADAQSALVDYIEMQGLQGYAADEAARTIQGSVSSMKGAWENLLVGMADDNADFGQLVNNLVDSAVTVGENIIPRVEQTIQGLATFISSASDTIIPLVVDTIVNNLPMIISAGVDLVVSLAGALIDAIPELLKAVPQIILAIANGLLSMAGKIYDAGASLVNKVKSAIMEKVNAAKQWGKDLIQNFIDGIKAKGRVLLDGVKDIAQGIKDFLGFSEPKLGPLSNFHTYAPDMMQLFAKGIKDNEHLITDQIGKSFDFGTSIVDSAKITGTVSTTDTALASEIAGLRNDVKNLKIYLSTGALVGGVTDGIDQALGQKTVANSRRRLATSYG